MVIAISGRINSGKDTVGKIIQYLTAKNEAILDINMPDRDYWINISFEDYFKYNMLVHKWQIKKFADKLKDIICLLIGCSRDQLEDESFKNTELGEEWWYFKGRNGTLIPYNENSKRNDEDLIKPTPRFLLQFIGTDLLRNQLHPQIWINSLMSEYKDYYFNIVSKEDRNRGVVPTVNMVKKEPNWIITDLRFPNELEAVKKRGGITIRVNRDYVLTGGPEDPKEQHESETALDKAEFDYEIDNKGSIEELIEKVRKILVTEKII